MMTLERPMVERLVRQALSSRLKPQGKVPRALGVSGGGPRLVVNISARHCHVTQEDLERLFGKGHQLKPCKWLYQDGFFAAEETVTIIGPRQRMIPNLRILGPCRDHSQVELAFTDAISLGLDVPVRKSGDHRDSPGLLPDGPGRHDPAEDAASSATNATSTWGRAIWSITASRTATVCICG